MIVMKFGGTSVESAAAIRRVAAIVQARIPRRPVVVVSAMGKTTNKLLAIADLAVQGEREDALEQTDTLRDFHLAEARELLPEGELREAAESTIECHFEELRELLRGVSVLGELTPRATDAVASYGERLSSAICALAFEGLGIPAVHVDSRDVVVTDDRFMQAAPLMPQTYSRLGATIPGLARDRVVVMGGFIAATQQGITSTLGRGGSDYTAAIVGAGIGADEIQIWTDVDGMLTADPTVMPGGHRVRVISFAEAAELAYFGAKVLHPSTVVPAIEKNIPVLILNSRKPEVEGTRIVRETASGANMAKSIACKKNISLVNIVSTRMLMAHGFLRRIFEIFDRFETPVDMVATTEVSVSLTVDNGARLKEITRELRQFAEVTVEDEQAIVCIVGDNIRHTPGVASHVFRALEDVNVRMISQGASLLNLSVVVAQHDLRTAVERLHAEFFTELDSEVFA
ncbi:MAG TPA: lysine-sensitive aspartokinase 3, partial [Bryobacteraceae bacterium]|nr:lysine-sensitive aspartokinase 3 [Bryobacteraceae bacterium]